MDVTRSLLHMLVLFCLACRAVENYMSKINLTDFVNVARSYSVKREVMLLFCSHMQDRQESGFLEDLTGMIVGKS